MLRRLFPLFVLLVPTLAHAQTPSPGGAPAVPSTPPVAAPPPDARANATIASALFEEGRKLMTAGKYDAACPKFAESQRLVKAGGTMLNLATCHQKAGKKALAFSEFEEALAIATQDNRKERIAFAKKQIAAIEPLLAKLVVTVPSADAAAPGLEVRVDDLPLPPAAFGVPVRVDAGAHVVTATADKKREFRGEATLSAKEAKEVTVNLSPAVPDPEPPKVDPVEPPKVEPPKVEPPKADPPKVEPPKVDATDPWKAPPPSPHAPRRTEIRTEGHPLALPFVLTGAVGLIGGMAAGAYGANKLLNPSVGSSCFSDASKCTTDSAKSRRNTGRTFLWVSGISMGTGLVFLITGVALPSKEVIVQTGGLRFRPVVDATPQGGYLGLSGSF